MKLLLESSKISHFQLTRLSFLFSSKIWIFTIELNISLMFKSFYKARWPQRLIHKNFKNAWFTKQIDWIIWRFHWKWRFHWNWRLDGRLKISLKMKIRLKIENFIGKEPFIQKGKSIENEIWIKNEKQIEIRDQIRNEDMLKMVYNSRLIIK